MYQCIRVWHTRDRFEFIFMQNMILFTVSLIIIQCFPRLMYNLATVFQLFCTILTSYSLLLIQYLYLNCRLRAVHYLFCLIKTAYRSHVIAYIQVRIHTMIYSNRPHELGRCNTGHVQINVFRIFMQVMFKVSYQNIREYYKRTLAIAEKITVYKNPRSNIVKRKPSESWKYSTGWQ